MSKKIFLLLSLSIYAVYAAPESVPSDKKWPNLDFNTPIRVLLEKGTTLPATVESLQNTLFVKFGEAPWKPMGRRAVVEILKHTGKLALNGLTLSDPVVYIRGGPQASDSLRFNHHRFRGALRFSSADEKMLIVNVLPLEEYLSGLLASEMSSSWPLEALKAQAVASRSYALYTIRHPKNPNYDLDKGIQDQVYSGVAVETPRADLAVDKTAGVYLGLNNEPVKTYFHARCGGSTETEYWVWKMKSKANQRRVACPFCRGSRYSWFTDIRLSDFFRILKIPTVTANQFSLKPGSRSPSGRLDSIEIRAGNKTKVIPTDEFRAKLGYTRLKSALFDWKVSRDSVQFDGYGAGHGVGMCQWGARYLAEKKRNFSEILAYYYPGLKLYDQSRGLKP